LFAFKALYLGLSECPFLAFLAGYDRAPMGVGRALPGEVRLKFLGLLLARL
jgi:hypothetical protein